MRKFYLVDNVFFDENVSMEQKDVDQLTWWTYRLEETLSWTWWWEMIKIKCNSYFISRIVMINWQKLYVTPTDVIVKATTGNKSIDLVRTLTYKQLFEILK